mmetsp:Transcript_60076/g.141733  ORF Transcript_60076/g.141733 Transcript_60076/m.141733 type:complete len:277 (-) Transcript_60076:2166-2996(-)
MLDDGVERERLAVPLRPHPLVLQQRLKLRLHLLVRHVGCVRAVRCRRLPPHIVLLLGHEVLEEGDGIGDDGRRDGLAGAAEGGLERGHVAEPHAAVRGLDAGDKVVDEGVDARDHGHELREALHGARAHHLGVLLERLDEGGLQLGQEGLHHDPSLLQQQQQRAHDRRLDLPREAVADDADQGPAHLHHHRLQRRRARRLHQLPEPLRRLLARLRRRAVHERLQEEGQDRCQPLAPVETRHPPRRRLCGELLDLVEDDADMHAAADARRLRVVLLL